MRDQVIGLEDKTDRVVAVGVPVAILVVSGGDVIDYQITFIISVQSADYI